VPPLVSFNAASAWVTEGSDHAGEAGLSVAVVVASAEAADACDDISTESEAFAELEVEGLDASAGAAAVVAGTTPEVFWRADTVISIVAPDQLPATFS